MNKKQIKELALQIFDAGKNDLPDKDFNEFFENLWSSSNSLQGGGVTSNRIKE